MERQFDKALGRFTKLIEADKVYEGCEQLKTVLVRGLRKVDGIESAKALFDVVVDAVLAICARIELSKEQKVLCEGLSDLVGFLVGLYENERIHNVLDKEPMLSFVGFSGRLKEILEVLSRLKGCDITILKEVHLQIARWNVKNYPKGKLGSSELHGIVGKRLLDLDDSFVYDAERYLLLSKEAYNNYIDLIWRWYTHSGAPPEEFASRLVMGYLSLYNIRDARNGLLEFIRRFEEKSGLKSHFIDKGDGLTLQEFEDNHAGLNFLQLLVISCQRRSDTLFGSLKTHYADYFRKYEKELAYLERCYFRVETAGSGNLFQEMLSGLFS